MLDQGLTTSELVRLAEAFTDFDSSTLQNFSPRVVDVIDPETGRWEGLGLAEDLDAEMFQIFRGLGMRSLFPTFASRLPAPTPTPLLATPNCCAHSAFRSAVSASSSRRVPTMSSSTPQAPGPRPSSSPGTSSPCRRWSRTRQPRRSRWYSARRMTASRSSFPRVRPRRALRSRHSAWSRSRCSTRSRRPPAVARRSTTTRRSRRQPRPTNATHHHGRSDDDHDRRRRGHRAAAGRGELRVGEVSSVGLWEGHGGSPFEAMSSHGRIGITLQESSWPARLR